MRSKGKVPFILLALSSILGLFLILEAFALPEGGQSVGISCGPPHRDGDLKFRIKGEWTDTLGKKHKFNAGAGFLFSLHIDHLNGGGEQKEGKDKAEEIYNYVKDNIPKVDHDNDPNTDPVPLFEVSWSGGNSTFVEFMPPDPNTANTQDLKIDGVRDGTGEHEKILSAAPMGYSILAEFVGDVTGQDVDNPAHPSRVRLGIDGTEAEVTVSGEITREALARLMADRLRDLGIRASVVRGTIIHIQTPLDTGSSLSYDNTDRGLEVWIDITD